MNPWIAIPLALFVLGVSALVGIGRISKDGRDDEREDADATRH